MSISISKIARDHADFIREQLKSFELALDPLEKDDDELVRRAVFSVRNKVIKFEKYNPLTETFFGSVNDVKRTTFAVSFFKREVQCSCPVKKCRHELGVLLSLYQYFGSVQDWAANWRSKKKQQISLLQDERSPENWKALILNVAGPFFPQDRALEIYTLDSILTTVHSRLSPMQPYEVEWKDIFKLYAELIVLNLMWKHFTKHHSRFASDYFAYNLTRRMNLIRGILDGANLKSPLFAQEPFLRAIQDEVREFGMHALGFPDLRFDLYCAVWEEALLSPKRCAEELEKLAEARGKLTVIYGEEFALRHVQPYELFQYVMMRDADGVQRVMTELQMEVCEFYAKVAAFAVRGGQLKLAERILISLLPVLHEYIQREMTPMYRAKFCQFLNRLYGEISLTEQQESMLFHAFGRFGIEPYSESLIRKERYDDWVAFNSVYISSLAYLDNIGLKEVVANAPASALPIYHIYAMEELKQKSRANYKQAVRIWRAMKQTAKKAGKLDYFHAYMENIQAKHKRLRALQEEILKANLTS